MHPAAIAIIGPIRKESHKVIPSCRLAIRGMVVAFEQITYIFGERRKLQERSGASAMQYLIGI